MNVKLLANTICMLQGTFKTKLFFSTKFFFMYTVWLNKKIGQTLPGGSAHYI